MSESLKILVCGDVSGKLDYLYSKVKSIQAKAGKFDVNLVFVLKFLQSLCKGKCNFLTF
jgi:hypothetical protein